MPPVSTAVRGGRGSGVVLAGIGLNQADSEAAIRTLPGGVTLAVSPYAQNTAKVLTAARAAEHEYLLSIPMEPQGFPLNDPGNQALMTSLSPEQNRSRLEWMLSRIAGYVGAVGAEGSMRGERFASLPEEIDPVLAATGAARPAVRRPTSGRGAAAAGLEQEGRYRDR